MKDRAMKLFFELLKDSKRSDRELAKVLGTSQPTVTRMRNKLVRDGLIQQFSIIPDFQKMGFEIMAISSLKTKISPKSIEKAKQLTISRPNIIFAATAEGMGKNTVLISIHKNYLDYSNFCHDLLQESGDCIESYDSLLISLEGAILKPFSLKYLAELNEASPQTQNVQP